MSWIIDDVADTKDPGIPLKHESFGKGEQIKVRSIVTDEIVKHANQLAAKVDKLDYDAEYRAQLIHAMVMDGTHVINARTKKPLVWTISGIRKLSPQQKNWIVDRITNECSGMRPPEVDVEIGQSGTADFRETA